MGFWTLGIFQDIENYDLQSSGTMFLRRLVAEKEPDVDDADEDNVALPGNSLRLRPNKPDLKNRFCYDRNGHDNVEVGESGIFSLNIVFFFCNLEVSNDKLDRVDDDGSCRSCRVGVSTVAASELGRFAFVTFSPFFLFQTCEFMIVTM